MQQLLNARSFRNSYVAERSRVVVARLLREGRASLEDLASEVKASPEFVLSLLESLPVKVEGGSVLVESKVDLLLEAWRRGLDPAELVLSAGWRDFEQLCAEVFERCGYRALLNVRVKSRGRSYELDVVAMRKPWVLTVDCKRWRRLRSGHLKNAASMQRARCSALANALAVTRNLRAEVKGWNEARVVPLVVNLYEGVTKVHDGVALVPLDKLVPFLNEFESYVDDLFVVSVKLAEKLA